MHLYFVVNEALEQPGQETEGKTYEGHKWVFFSCHWLPHSKAAFVGLVLGASFKVIYSTMLWARSNVWVQSWS